MKGFPSRTFWATVLVSLTIGASAAAAPGVASSAVPTAGIHRISGLASAKSEVCAALNFAAGESTKEVVNQVVEFFDSQEINWFKVGLEALLTVGNARFCSKSEQSTLNQIHKFVAPKPKALVSDTVGMGSVFAPAVHTMRTSYIGDNEYSVQTYVTFVASQSPVVSNVAMRLEEFDPSSVRQAGTIENFDFPAGQQYDANVGLITLLENTYYEVEIQNVTPLTSDPTWVCGQEFWVNSVGQVSFYYPPLGSAPLLCPQN
jgi:hypothetical protein